MAYAQQKKNPNHARNFLVKYLPQSPRSPRRHSFHFCALRSALSSLLPAFVMFRSSSAFHSGPKAGTVTISTGPMLLAASDSSLPVSAGEFTGR